MSYKRHDWFNPLDPTVANFLKPDTRECKNCGIRQVYEEQHLWMRKVGGGWEPKISPKCKGKK